jgi:hypothetical protein
VARHLPADHSLGDANTIGGYAAVHARPAAFEGADGCSYSVEIVADATPDAADGAWGAYLLFVRWRRYGEPGAEGHLETPYLAYGPAEADARAAVAAMPLSAVRDALDALVRERVGGEPRRRWWDAMRDEGDA